MVFKNFAIATMAIKCTHVALWKSGNSLGPACCWLLLVLGLPLTLAAQAETRVALVVGNSDYQHTSPLRNPRKDADAIATKLHGLGFTVRQGYDLKHDEALELLRDFGASAKGADIVVFYYAGHAMQVNGQNYLVPVDASLRSEADLKYEGLPLAWFMEELTKARRMRLVFLDACRDNPLAQSMARTLSTRSAAISRGLARIDPQQLDTLIVYATAADEVAEDGSGNHSPFTSALLDHMATPGLDVRLMLGKVRDHVNRATDGRQQPFFYGSLGGETWAFNPGQTASPLGGSPEVTGTASAIDYWDQIKDSRNPATYEAFLANFHDPILRTLAEDRLRELRAAFPPSHSYTPPSTPFVSNSGEPIATPVSVLPPGKSQVDLQAKMPMSSLPATGTATHPSPSMPSQPATGPKPRTVAKNSPNPAKSVPKDTSPSPRSGAPQPSGCGRLLTKLQLGEPLSAADRAIVGACR